MGMIRMYLHGNVNVFLIGKTVVENECIDSQTDKQTDSPSGGKGIVNPCT